MYTFKHLYILQLANAIYDTLDGNKTDWKAKRPMPADAPPADAPIMVAARIIAQAMRDAEDLAQELNDAVANASDTEGEAYGLKTLLKEKAAKALDDAVNELKSNFTESVESMCETLGGFWEEPEHEQLEQQKLGYELEPLSNAHAWRFRMAFARMIVFIDIYGNDAAPPPPPGGPDDDDSGKAVKIYTPRPGM